MKKLNEYLLTRKQHKDLFPGLKYKYGLVNYRYIGSEENGIKVYLHYTPLIYLWILIMFIPSILISGIPSTLKEIRELYIKEFVFVMDYILPISKRYEKFMKMAKIKKRG